MATAKASWMGSAPRARRALREVSLADVVEGADVAVVQRRDGLRFALKALPRLWIRRQPACQHFDRDDAIEARVASAIHLSHSASADGVEDFVRTEAGALRQGWHWGSRQGAYSRWPAHARPLRVGGFRVDERVVHPRHAAGDRPHVRLALRSGLGTSTAEQKFDDVFSRGSLVDLSERRAPRQESREIPAGEAPFKGTRDGLVTVLEAEDAVGDGAL